MDSKKKNILEYAFDSGQNASIILGRDRIILRFNALAGEWINYFFGKELAEGRNISDYLDEEDLPEFALALREFDQGEAPLPIVNILRRDDDEKWYETNFFPLGEDRNLLLSITDITIRKQTFDRLSENERRFKALMQHSPGITVIIDRNGEILFISESVTTFIGYTAQECRGRNIMTMVHESDSRKMSALISDIGRSHGLVSSAEIQIVNKDETSLFFDVKGSNQTENPVVGGIILNMHDITERKYIDEMMHRIARHNNLILETASEGIFGVNTRSIITFINPYAAAILGYRQDELVGHSLLDFLSDEESELRSLDCSKPIRSAETVFSAKDGRRFPVEFSSNPIIDNGICSGNVITFNDISDRKRIERELIAAKNEAENANRAKSDFLASMSHEIRTPMNSILGYIELVSMGRLDEKQKEYLEIVAANSQTLIAIINDILDISKIEKGRIELDAVPFNPIKEIARIIDLFSAKAAAKKIRLEFARKSVPECIGDPTRFGQVLSNLVGNAVKFTNNGGSIIVEIASRQSHGIVCLDVSVTDTGIGISADRQKAVFDAFTQSDPSIYRRYGGTGLGLAISSKIVALMGGDLSIKSSPGRGSRFFFSIELPPAAGTIGAEESAAEAAWFVADTEKSVLIADDTPDSLRLLALMLGRMNVRADTAENGVEAFDLYTKNEYDLVILDGNMPEMDGAETSRRIRRYEAEKNLKRTPIIALSAKVLTADREEFLGAGADTFVSKPLSFRALSETVGVIFGNNPAQTGGLSSHDDAAEDYIGRLSAFLGIPEGGIRGLLSDLLTSFPGYVSDVEKSLNPYDRQALEHAAHKFKGIAASYMLDDLYEQCGIVEEEAQSGKDDQAAENGRKISAAAEVAGSFLRQVIDYP
jgi:PAS domain S-box-containing protein